MEDQLRVMLKKEVAIPYNDNMVETIKKACNLYNLDNKYLLIDEMVGCFLLGKVPLQFKTHLESALKEKEIKTILPTNVIRVIAQYYSYILILNETDILNKSIYATILMNYMIVVTGQFSTISNPTLIKDIYKFHISKYLSENDNVDMNISITIIDKINKGTNLSNDLLVNDPTINSQMKVIAKQSTLYRFYSILKDEDIQSTENPFRRVYKGLKLLFSSIDYPYYNFDIKRTIETLIKDNESKKREKIGSIIGILSSDASNKQESLLNSSVLIRLINSNESYYPNNLKEQYLTIEEFAIYLYYELLLECIIKKNLNNGK